MLIPTHRIIAHHMYHQINQTLDIKINKTMLVYGNMKPDVAPKLKSKKHYKEPTLDFVIDEIYDLIENGLSEIAFSINKFSVKLGVITHFLSDFFCLPHHDRTYFSDKLMEHMVYEKKLHTEFKKFSGIDKIKMPYIREISREEIRNFIEELHMEYVQSPAGYQTDIQGSINISSAIGVMVIENSILCDTPAISLI